MEAVVEVGFELAGHEDVLEEDEDAVYVVGELSDLADFLPGLAAEYDAGLPPR